MPELDAAASLSGAEFSVTHCIFLGFDVDAMPHDTRPFRDYWSRVHATLAGKPSIVVHCANGVGLTGVFICMDMAMATYAKKKFADLYDILVSVRHYRPRAVETRAQYMYLHRAFLDQVMRLAVAGKVKQEDHGTFVQQFTVPEKDKGFDLGVAGREILRLGKFEMRPRSAAAGGKWTPTIVAVSQDLIILTKVVNEHTVVLQDYQDWATATAKDVKDEGGNKFVFELGLQSKVLLKAADAATKQRWLTFLRQQEEYVATADLSGARLTKEQGLCRADALAILGCHDPQTESGSKALKAEFEQVPQVLYGGPGSGLDAGGMYALPQDSESGARTAVNPMYQSLSPAPSSMVSMSPARALLPPDYYSTTQNPLTAGVHMDEKFMRYNRKLDPNSSHLSANSSHAGYTGNVSMTPMPNDPMSPLNTSQPMVFRDLEAGAIKATEDSIAEKLAELSGAISHAERLQQLASGRGGTFTLESLSKNYSDQPAAAHAMLDVSGVGNDSVMPGTPTLPADGLNASIRAEVAVPDTPEQALLRKYGTPTAGTSSQRLSQSGYLGPTSSTPQSQDNSLDFPESPARPAKAQDVMARKSLFDSMGSSAEGVNMATFASKELKERLWQLFHKADAAEGVALFTNGQESFMKRHELDQKMTGAQMIELLKHADVLHTIDTTGNGSVLNAAQLLHALNKKPNSQVTLAEFLELLQPSSTTAESPAPTSSAANSHSPPQPAVPVAQAPRFNVKMNLEVRSTFAERRSAKHVSLDHTLFAFMNKNDDDNVIDIVELEAALSNPKFWAAVELHGIDLKRSGDSKGDAARLMAVLDRNGNGTVSMTEFLQGLTKLASSAVAGDGTEPMTLQSFKYMLKRLQPELFEIMDGDAEGETQMAEGIARMQSEGGPFSADDLQQMFFDIFDDETKRDARAAGAAAETAAPSAQASPQGRGAKSNPNGKASIAADLDAQAWQQSIAPRGKKGNGGKSSYGKYETIKDNPLSPKYVLKIRPSIPAKILVKLKEQSRYGGDPSAFNVTTAGKRRMTRMPTVRVKKGGNPYAAAAQAYATE